MSTHDELAVLLAEQQRRRPPATFQSLEELLTKPDLFALTTASPVQRALCRIAEGAPLGELAGDPAVVRAIGDPTLLPKGRPTELVVLSGIRVGKSLIAAALAVYWSQVCDVSKLGPGEIPRISIVSINKGSAQVIFDHIKGRIEASPVLSKLLVDKPGAESLYLRHPTGIPIEVMVVAGSRAGGTLVSRWSAGCIFDEFPRMVGSEEGVVNWPDMRQSAIMRILKGCQMVSIGSPWAPAGPAYDIVNSHWKKPTKDLIVIKSPGWDFNPHYWTEENLEKARRDPNTFQTEAAAEFASPEESMYTNVEIDSAIRAMPLALPPDSTLSYRAAMDPATRGNGWSLVISTRQGRMKKVAFAKEWVGTKLTPLKPREVLADIAYICRQYGINTIDSDQWSIDAIRDLANEYGLYIRQVNWKETEKTAKYVALKTKFQLGEIELAPVAELRSDLIQVRRRPTNAGVKIILPSTSDGRHCDYIPSLLMSLSQWLDDVAIDQDSPDLQTKWDLVAAKMKAEREREVVVQQQRKDNLRNSMPAAFQRRFRR